MHALVGLRFWQRAAPVFVTDILRMVYICDDETDALLLQELLAARSDQEELGEFADRSIVCISDGRPIDQQLLDLERLMTVPFDEMERRTGTFTALNGQRFSAWIVDYWGWVPAIGIVGEEIGYQRSGMTYAFRSAFQNSAVYTERADFERMLDYIDMSSTYAGAVQQNIQTNFLDRFIPGETFIYADW